MKTDVADVQVGPLLESITGAGQVADQDRTRTHIPENREDREIICWVYEYLL